jgi:hypothetical protein
VTVEPAARLLFVGLAVGLAACGTSPGGSGNIAVQSNDGGGPDLADVVYAAQASDDALRRMLSVPAQNVAGWGLVINSPSGGTALAPDAPVAFSYRPMTAQLARPGLRHGRAVDVGPFRRALAELGALLGPERLAHAHGPPFNGTGTLLVVTDATGARCLRVFTGDSSFTPTDSQWAALAAGQQPLTLTLTWAEFDDNRIPDGYGPFVGGTLQFQIGSP